MTVADSLELKPARNGSDPGAGSFTPKRLTREHRTIAAMIGCFCAAHHHHANEGFCPECQQLMDYATLRLERCRFGVAKPVCAKCPVHCYQRSPRDQIRAVMRYAGPRMVWQHPILSFRHWLDGFRRAPGVG